MPSETTTACISLLVFFRIRRGSFPYGVEDDASTISQTPTTHYTNTSCVKLTIVTHLSFSERIAIANLSLQVKGACCIDPCSYVDKETPRNLMKTVILEDSFSIGVPRKMMCRRVGNRVDFNLGSFATA